MKNICFVNTTPTWGGGEKWHSQTANYLYNKSYPVYFIQSFNSNWKDQISIPLTNIINIKSSFFKIFNLFQIFKIYNFFKKHNIHILIINSSNDLKFFGFLAYIYKIDKIIYRRGLAKEVKNNIINTFLFDKVITDFIVNSLETKKLLFKNIKVNSEHSRIHLIYNAINPLPYIKASKNTLPKNKKAVVLGIAARLVKQKGYHYLVQIVKKLSEFNLDFQLKIAGIGNLEGKLKKQFVELNLIHNVNFLGFVDDMPEFMSNLDIYLCTSIFEGFGFSIAEAMLSNKPVVAFNISSNNELVDEAKTGYLIKPFDIDAFASKILQLSNNTTLRVKLGQEAFLQASQKFNLNTQNSKLEQLLTI